MKTQDRVTLKGTRNGFLILIGEENDFGLVLGELREKLGSAAGFFKGAGALVEVGGRALSEEENAQLLQILQDDYGMVVRSPRKEIPEPVNTNGKEQPASIALASPKEEKTPEQETQVALPRLRPARNGAHRPSQAEDNTLFIHRTVRSGQCIRYDGSVVVIGDVNPGAEIVASGDIIVLGVFRGVAHAGARGDVHSLVAALCLAPTQLRIASSIGRAPDESGNARPRPEMAVVKDGALVIEPFPGWEALG